MSNNRVYVFLVIPNLDTISADLHIRISSNKKHNNVQLKLNRNSLCRLTKKKKCNFFRNIDIVGLSIFLQ